MVRADEVDGLCSLHDRSVPRTLADHGSTRRRRSRSADQAPPVLERRVRAPTAGSGGGRGGAGRSSGSRRPCAPAGDVAPSVPALVHGRGAGLLVLDALLEGERQGDRSGTAGGVVHRPARGTADAGAAQSTVGGTEAILDVQTHLLDYELVPEGPDFWSGFPYKNCGEAEQRDCFGVDHWMEELFLRSDTAMVVLSAVPIVGDADPLSIDVMERARRVATQLCGDGRVLLQGHAVPNVGRIDAALDGMRAVARLASDRGLEGVHTCAGTGVVVRRRHGRRRSSRPSRRSPRPVAPASSLSTRGSRAATRRRRRWTSARRRGPPGSALRRVPLRLRGRRTRKTRSPTNGGGVDRLVRSLPRRGHPARRQRVRRARVDMARGDGRSGPGRARARQAARRGRGGQRPVGHRLDLVRLAPGPDPGVPHVRAHGGGPGAIRLSGADASSEAEDLRRQRGRLYGVDLAKVAA